MSFIHIGIIQLKTTADKQTNLETAALHVAKVKEQGAQMAILPEMFLCPYAGDQFFHYAEEAQEESWRFLSEIAQKNNIILIAGSVPELENGNIYNTSYVFDENGTCIGKHRKMHLFNIDIKGGQKFQESDTLTAGNQVTVFDTNYGRFGLCICFDIRFPELARIMAELGAQAIFVPAAFNMSTGPLHWELLFRSRAADNQLYTIGVSSARDTNNDYIAYGHSIVCNPWGQIVYEAEEYPVSKIVSLDLSLINQVRAQLPLISAIRKDVYTINLLNK